MLSAEPHKVYVVEDHERLRGLIVGYLKHLESVSVIGEAASAEAALADPVHIKADVILTDLSMPGMSGIQLAEKLYAENPAYHVILLTAHGDSYHIEAAFEAGVDGYILKEDPYSIEEVISRVVAGERHVVVTS